MSALNTAYRWLKKTLIRKEMLCLCLIAGLCMGLFAHGFMFANKIYNHDDLYYYDDLGNAGIQSGRYFLHFFWKLFSDMSTPWLNGILGVLFLCFASYFLCDAFELRQRWQILIISGLIQMYPTNVSIYCFMYQSHVFMLALMLAAMAPWLLKREKGWYRFPLAAAVIMMATGVYQVFLMYSIGLLILLVVFEVQKSVEKGEQNAGRLWGYAIWAAAAAIAGLVLYLVGLKLIQQVGGVQLNAYQGINETGKLTLSLIPGKIVQAYWKVWNFYLERIPDYVTGRMQIFRGSLAVMAIVCLAAGVIRCLFRKAYWQGLLILLCTLLLPLACYGISFMGDKIGIHMITLYPMILVLLIPVILLRTNNDEKRFSLRSLLAAGMLCLYMGYGFTSLILCNQAYYRHYMAFSRAEHMAARIASRIEKLPEYKPGIGIDIVGSLDETGSLFYREDYLVSRFLPFFGVRMATDYTWPYTLPNMLSAVIGLPVEWAGNVWSDDPAAVETVQNMPCYPQEGSIAIVNDVCIIKFSDN